MIAENRRKGIIAYFSEKGKETGEKERIQSMCAFVPPHPERIL
jgi:hypothetical protein